MINWIKFTDKSPVDGDAVIYYFSITGVGVGRFEAPNIFYGSLGCLTGDVSHWMPISYFDDFAILIDAAVPDDKQKVIVYSTSKGYHIAEYLSGKFYGKLGMDIVDVIKWVPMIPSPVES